jgi:hypothetical protein
MFPLILVLLLVGVQGSAQANEAALKKALDLIIDNKGVQAIALLEPLVAKNPNAADVHDMLASAHAAAAEALEGDAGAVTRRRRHLEAAAVHLKRTIELTRVNIAANLDSLVDIYSPTGLNQPALAETYARRLVEEHPSLSSGYAPLARLLAESNRLDAARDVLTQARSAVAADSREFIATQLFEQVELLPQTAAPAAQLLLNEAMWITDALIAASPGEGKFVMFKSAILEKQANRVEQDPAQRASMLEESRRLWEKGRELNAARRANEPAAPPPPPTVPPAAEERHRAGVELWDRVNSNPKMPPAEARKLLSEAIAAFDAALKAHPDYMEALVFKSVVLRLDATRYEKDGNRAKEMIAEADRLRARAMDLQKNKR